MEGVLSLVGLVEEGKLKVNVRLTDKGLDGFLKIMDARIPGFEEHYQAFRDKNGLYGERHSTVSGKEVAVKVKPAADDSPFGPHFDVDVLGNSPGEMRGLVAALGTEAQVKGYDKNMEFQAYGADTKYPHKRSIPNANIGIHQARRLL